MKIEKSRGSLTVSFAGDELAVLYAVQDLHHKRQELAKKIGQDAGVKVDVTESSVAIDLLRAGLKSKGIKVETLQTYLDRVLEEVTHVSS